MGGEEPVEECFEDGDVAHFGGDMRDHHRVVVRPWEGQPFESQGDIGTIFEPEQPHSKGGEEPGSSDVGPIDVDVPDAVSRGEVGHGGEGELGVVCGGVAVLNIKGYKDP